MAIQWKQAFKIAVYHIRSIRRRGYYLFHRPILYGIYSRVVTNRERLLLIQANLSLIPRPLPRFQCTLDTADESDESDTLADIKMDEDKLEENKLVLDDS